MIGIPGKRGLTPEVVATSINQRCEGYFDSFRVLEDGTPTRNHRWIAAAARSGVLRYIVTTNFDIFLERALDAASVSYRLYRTDEEFRAFRDADDGPAVHLLKLHGCITVPTTITATVEQEDLGMGSAKTQALDLLLRRRWLVVWGYSGADLKINLDYLRMVSRKDDAAGFVWSLFARESFYEEPNLYVQRLAEAYGERALFGHNLLPRAFEVVTRPSDRPELVTVSEEQRRAWQENKNERLGHLLDEWAQKHVDPLTACLITGELLSHNGNIEQGITCFHELELLAIGRRDPITQSTALGKRAGLLSHSGHLAEAVSYEHSAVALADWVVTLGDVGRVGHGRMGLVVV
jgi:hypothetical protein